MRYTITGRNINVTPGIRRAVEEKIGKLDRYFNPDTEVIVTLSVQKDKQKIEVTIPVKGNIIRAEESSTDMYASIDLVEEVIERQLKKYKNKLIDKNRLHRRFPTSSSRKSPMPRRRSRLSRQNVLASSPWIRKRLVCRWNCWATIFMCSSIPRPRKSMWSTSGRAIPTG